MYLEDLRNELRDLGFEEDETMTEYNEIFLNAVNRASWIIHDTVVSQLRGWYKRNLKKTTTTTVEIYDDGGTKMKSTSVEVDFEREKTTTTTVTTADPEDEYGTTTTVLVEPWIYERPEVLTEDSDDETVIGLPDNVLRPMALLTAHYLWLDDDEQKAIYYYNEYESFIASLINSLSMDASATIQTTGWGW